jgi:3-oxoacyl-[acyl-carrier-protein] synthase II
VQAAYEAMVESGIYGNIDPIMFGVSVGANIGAVRPEVLARLIDGIDQSMVLSPQQALQNHPGTLAAVLANRWRCEGAVTTMQTACASSGQSIGQAFLQIQRGECDAVLAGGADSLAAEMLLAGFCLLGALSTRNDDPAGASRPFDKDRDGFVAGEGAAMLVLEEYEHALRRGATIYCEVVGYGETASAYRITDLPPNGRGIVEAMHGAVQQSGLDYSDISYINAHGTSTELNDRIEALAVRRVFGSRGVLPLISSTKSETGHLISAAGALELAFCALAVRDQQVPPTINFDRTDCGEDLDFVANTSRNQPIIAAMSNSIGFGGSNSSLIVKRLVS